MANINQAPLIKWDFPNEKDNNWETDYYTQYNNNFLEFAVRNLKGSELKVFLILTEVAYGSFRLSKETALYRTGLSNKSYYEARNGLEDKGWITLENGDIPAIVINTKEIKRQMGIEQEEPNEREIRCDFTF